MKKLITSTLAVGLLFVAASCGSDEEKSDTTSATETSTDVSTDASTETSADAPVAAGDVDLSSLDEVHAQAAAQGIASAAAAGVALDGDCFVAIVAQLSDEDAQLIVDAGVDGDPQLSAEGEALGAEIVNCATVPTVGT